MDGGWGKWSEWESCSASCGGGTRTRFRKCDSPVADYGGSYCVGDDKEVDTCNEQPCCGRYMQW